MTPVKDVQRGDRGTTLPAISEEAMTDAVEQYLTTSIFRAARYEELVLDDNPYRRPVRPDDIGLVDFSRPLRREEFSRLSALMGHRMLLNIHDTRKLLLPHRPTAEKWRDYQQFYGSTNRFLGDVIRPYLEAHLFGFVHDAAAATPRATTAADLLARADEIGAERRRQAGELRGVLESAADREPMVQMLAIQSVATWLNNGTQPASALRTLTGSPATANALVDAPGRGLLGRVADGSGIRYEAHSYFQYYLPSTLALMNYVNATAQDPGQVFAFAGAMVAQASEASAVDDELATLLADRVGDPAGQQVVAAGDAMVPARQFIEVVERIGGEFGLREFGRGLDEYAVLLDVHHEDRMRQFRWITDMPAFVDKADRLHTAIRDHAIEVQLDTFVESWEECSTTHVHDDDRLLVIESGEMEFWNCFGTRHKMRAGDMSFIPKHRLHGSVVLTGECVYHQPVITPELDRQFG